MRSGTTRQRKGAIITEVISNLMTIQVDSGTCSDGRFVLHLGRLEAQGNTLSGQFLLSIKVQLSTLDETRSDRVVLDSDLVVCQLQVRPSSLRRAVNDVLFQSGRM